MGHWDSLLLSNELMKTLNGWLQLSLLNYLPILADSYVCVNFVTTGYPDSRLGIMSDQTQLAQLNQNDREQINLHSNKCNSNEALMIQD